MKLNKKQIKIIAQIHSATVLRMADMWMFDFVDDVSEEDQIVILKEVHNIASKLTNHPLNLGSTTKIIKYVKSLSPSLS